MKDLKETVAAAKEEGLSYGEYTTQNSPPVEVNVPPGLKTQREKDAEHPPAQPEAEKSGKTGKTCPVCGKSFFVGPGQHRKKYCSDACRDQAAKTGKPVKPKPAEQAAEPSKEPEPVRAEPEKRPRITFGDILDLLGRDSTEVELRMGDDNISGSAGSRLWKWLEPARVKSIGADEDGLTVWLEERP